MSLDEPTHARALPKRILFICHELTRGGAERQLVSLALGLHERGWRTAVAVYQVGGTFENELNAAGVPIIDLRYGGRSTMLAFLFRLRRVVRKFRPTVVHGYLDLSNVLASFTGAFNRERKVVWGVRASAVDFDWYGGSRRFYDRLATWTARSADLIIANSHAGRQHHVGLGYPPDRCVVIPNGIDTDHFRPDATFRARTRRSLAIPVDAPLVGIVARLDPMKDHRTFLRAASQVARREEQAVFACVGGGPAPLRNELETLASELGVSERVLWLGSRDDMVALYNAFDMTCLTSAFGEGFPNVVGESMACGTPCVVTDVGDSALLVGDTGRLVPPRDPDRLATAIVAMIEHVRNERAPMSEAVRAHIVGNFQIDQLVERTEYHLGSLMGLASPGQHEPNLDLSPG